ncbi:PD-(D/E)XK nuclease family protein [Bacillus sp. P14.5]|uniref:PD-(D/E)XK nuclease family protein n=1 Tax=Bacillus sp. P14.5 TaxID=1983400 RepID=UPI000DEA7781|nr:PD-(D/E)XK nuclease family protein [Bacillus sp. P14.5]
MTTKPNIFRFATKELTQDAFLCWSLSWANQTENIAMRQFSIDLLGEMLAFHNIKISGLDGLERLEVIRQHKNIDILLRFRINSIHYRIIIEDKTNTSMHSEQLERYFDEIRSEPCDGMPEILGVYYKTGFIFDNEIRYINDFNNTIGKFKVFNRQDMIELMKKYQAVVKSDLFHDYYEYLCEIQREEDEIKMHLNSSDNKQFTNALKTQVGQWIFMKELFSRMEGDFHIYRGNSSGRPWTQCSFIKVNTSLKFPESLFYRLDRRSEGVYLSLRQYYNYQNQDIVRYVNSPVSVIREEKVSRLNELRRLFDETIDQIGERSPGILLETGKRVPDYAGKKESEVGVFFLKGPNSPDKIKRFIPEFHSLFVKKVIEKEGWGFETYKEDSGIVH